MRPRYPAEAQKARAQGIVVIEVTIDPTGKVGDARVMRSIPLLDQAALEAVRQWEWAPTIVDGKAVPVIATVTVNFTMQEPPASIAPSPAPPALAAEKPAQPAPGGPAAEFQATLALTRDGRGLSAQQASDLEDRLKSNPDDSPARMRLLGYYFASSIRTAGAEATRAARRRHVLWLIEHRPEAEVMMLPDITIDPAGHSLADADGYAQARALWLQQVDRRPDDVGVLMHAAHFVRLSDKAMAITLLKRGLTHPASPDYWRAASELGATYAVTVLGITMINNNGLPMAVDPADASSDVARSAADDLRASSNAVVISTAGSMLAQYGAMAQVFTKGAVNQDGLAEELLKKAVALDPPNLLAPHALADFYRMRMLRAQSPEDRQAMAVRRLEQAELFVERARSFAEFAPLTRPWVPTSLLDAAKAAFDAGATDKARRFANDLLDKDSASGQSVHDANLVLGRVALKGGEVEQAKAHLLQAGRVPGGGTLTSFGPNMSLAKELLERGERDAVVSYLEACRLFWQSPRLTEWIQTIKAGGTPDFGANLIY